MSAEIFQFTPRRNLEARENLDEFIRCCRKDLTVFGADLDWHADYWPSAGISFGNLNQKTRVLDPVEAMRAPFVEFAKAYFRYQQGHKPTKVKAEMPALKCLERALGEGCETADILDCTNAVLDRAAVLATQTYSPGQAYRLGSQLQRLARFLSNKHLIPRQLDWVNPIRRPTDTVRTGAKAKREREKKLPNEEALHALADIFASNPTAPRDIFTSAVAAMLLCAPSRISEILALPVDCEVWEKKRDGSYAYGWRFQPAKGAPPQVKWIPSSMESLAQEAISRVRELTRAPRALALFYEKHPEAIFRHAHCPNVAEDEPLSTIQTCSAIGLAARDQRQARNSLRQVRLKAEDGNYTLRSLRWWVNSKLPRGFPHFDFDRGIRYSEALFCMQAHQLRPDLATSPVLLWRPRSNTVNDDLGSRNVKPGYTRPSIFDRHGFNHGRHTPIKLTSHQFRHLLNTMAQRGGLSQFEIARWSGRTDAKQNRNYDHMSEFEMLDMIRSHDDDLVLHGSLEELAEQVTQRLPMTRTEFNTLAMPTAHVTELGFCTHDYTMSPCQRHADCLNCSEQVVVKGDRRLEGLKDVHEKLQELCERAEREIAEGTAGADRWYERQCLTEARTRELLDVMKNPQIPNGALIKLRNPNEYSPFRRAVESRVAVDDSDSEHRLILEDMRRLLAGVDGDEDG